MYVSVQCSSVQSLSHVQLFATPWTAAHQASLSIANSWPLLRLKSVELVMPSSHLIFCCPLLHPPSVFPSIRVISHESRGYIKGSILSACLLTCRVHHIKYKTGYADDTILIVTWVYVPWFFVSSQQRFGAMDIKALGASHLLGLGQTVL